MEVCWLFYRFDYDRYLAMRPALRSATTPPAFAVLAIGPETEAIVDALVDGKATLLEAREAFVRSLCCLGDPLPFDKGFPRILAALGRYPGAVEAAELLGEMVAGGKNMEPWFYPAPGLVGLLTPEETAALHHSFARVAGQGHLIAGKRKRRRKRRGGLIGACAGFLRLLLDLDPEPDEMVDLLGELIDDAARRGQGIAVAAG